MYSMMMKTGFGHKASAHNSDAALHRVATENDAMEIAENEIDSGLGQAPKLSIRRRGPRDAGE